MFDSPPIPAVVGESVYLGLEMSRTLMRLLYKKAWQPAS